MLNNESQPGVVHHHIKEWRAHRNLRQEDLGALIGMDQSTISKWERGISHPTMRDIDALAKALETTPSNLVAVKPEQENVYDEVVTRLQNLSEDMRAAVFRFINFDPNKVNEGDNHK